MTGPPAKPSRAKAVRGLPTVVVVGAVTRDLDPADPRGWRLGGGSSFGALTLARLGLPTIAVLGVDEIASQAWELGLLRDAGVDVRVVSLAHGPVFENRETPTGRVQRSLDTADPIEPVAALGAWPDLAGAAAWLLAPVAGELPDRWADVPSAESLVALAWQGLLRRLEPGALVRRVPPAASPLLRRADIVGLGRDDVDPAIDVSDLLALLRPGATLLFTRAGEGGVALEAGPGNVRRPRRYPAVPASRVVDPTGAGDAFLAAVLAARVEPGLVGGREDRGYDLLLGATVASFVVEGVGLAAVPSRSSVGNRMRNRPRDR